MSIFDRLTDKSRACLMAAKNFAVGNKLHYVATEFIVMGILSVDCKARALLIEHGVEKSNYLPRIVHSFDRNSPIDGCTANCLAVIDKAVGFAVEDGLLYAWPEHILLAVLSNKNCLAYSALLEMRVNIESLKRQLNEFITYVVNKEKSNATQNRKASENNLRYEPENTQTQDDDRSISLSGIAEREKIISENCPLFGFGEDLTLKALKAKLDPVIGRDNEIAKVIQALSRRLKNSPLLVGEPGIGKSAVVEGLAQKIATGEVPSTLKNKTVFALDMTLVVAGAKYRGEFEERFNKIINYAKENDDIILFIDEIHTLCGAGGDQMGATEMLKPLLARGGLQIIGATTVSEYRKFIEKDAALNRRFQVIGLEPPKPEECIKIIKGIKEKFEAYHNVEILDEAVESAVLLSERYITDRFLPDKAIDLIDEAAAHARVIANTPDKDVTLKEEEVVRLVSESEYLSRQGKDVSRIEEKITKLNNELDETYAMNNKKKLRNRVFIDGDDVAKVLSEMTSIPVAKLTETEAEKLKRLDSVLYGRVIGQNDAVEAVTRAVKRARACVKDANRPIGSFIFVGPTGVGKTELSKALAETLFGDEKAMIRIDMSEYMEKASVSKLIGAPPGYVGYDEEGQLTEKVRRKPFSVVLFDEIEKANVDVFNLMLQILDDGRLTDSKGRTVDFKNTIIIMTSNIGAKEANQNSSFGFGKKSATEVKDIFKTELKKHFRPEFLNRIDEIIVFNKLEKEDCKKIAKLIVDKLIERLKLQNIVLAVDEGVYDLILDKGYDGEYGARPLRRTVQRLLEDSISECIISGEIISGNKITAVTKNGEVKFIHS
ncbi:MAG: ATP-dependent Clp protease ATP-binding subunit [Christensenellaceae bacterium]